MFYKITGISPTSGKGKVSITYRQPGFETRKSTGVTVRPRDFDVKTGKVHSRVAEHPELNARIQEMVTKLETAIRDVKARNNNVITKELLDKELATNEILEDDIRRVAGRHKDWFPKHSEEVEAKIEDKIKKLNDKLLQKRQSHQQYHSYLAETVSDYEPPKKYKATVTLATQFADYISLNPEHKRPKTLDGYQDTLDKLVQFNASISLEEVNLKFFQSFQSHLVGVGMRNGSVRTYLHRFKKLYTTLADEANLPYSFLKKFKMVEELADENVISLTQEEIVAIEMLPLRSLRQCQIRAQLLFSCEVGLRHSDLYITTNNIKGDNLHVVMRKGKRVVKPPLSARAKAILASEYFPFHPIKINQYNNGLKAIAKKISLFHTEEVFTHFVGNNPVIEKCQRWEAISSHVGRKTAINRWLAEGVRESVVARWVGHKDTKMLQKHYQDYETASAQEAQKLK